MVTKKLFFKDCHLAGRKYHDADEVNRFDPYAVMVVFEKEDDEYLLGYIPRGENETISNLLEMGWGNIFECRISKIDPEMHPEEQIHLVIKILKK